MGGRGARTVPAGGEPTEPAAGYVVPAAAAANAAAPAAVHRCGVRSPGVAVGDGCGPVSCEVLLMKVGEGCKLEGVDGVSFRGTVEGVVGVVDAAAVAAAAVAVAVASALP